MTAPVWPRGTPAIYRKIADSKTEILGGTLLAIDPSSGGTSLPGFAVFEAGVLINSGALKFPKPKLDVYLRLPFLFDQVAAILGEPPDVLVIEEIHKAMGHQSLLWAVGTSIAAVRSPVTIELPINIWRALAKVSPDYVKDDAADAVIMGRAVIMLAQRDKGES